MIVIIDYDTGNIRSVENALRSLGAEYLVSSDKEEILKADKVIMPGVGEASSAMEKLRERSLDTLIPSLRMPVLGICIGLQLMCLRSEEEDTPCLGIFNSAVRRFSPSDSSPEEKVKIPHMGWNTVEGLSSRLFNGVELGTFVYYVHSYAPDISENTVAVTTYGRRSFSAALSKGNFYGVQFHPEKSGDSGRKILRNFLEIV